MNEFFKKIVEKNLILMFVQSLRAKPKITKLCDILVPTVGFCMDVGICHPESLTLLNFPVWSCTTLLYKAATEHSQSVVDML